MTPADVLAELGRGAGWCIWQVLFTTNGWWIMGGALAAWAVVFSISNQRRLREARRQWAAEFGPFIDRPPTTLLGEGEGSHAVGGSIPSSASPSQALRRA